MLLKMKTKARIEYYNSKMQWHRDNDRPVVIWSGGFKEWFINGKYMKGGRKFWWNHAT